MRTQGEPGLKGPSTAPAGGSIQVHVSGNDPFVEVSTTGGAVTRYPVDPEGNASIPTPQLPAGTVIAVTVGEGLKMEVLLIEIVDTE